MSVFRWLASKLGLVQAAQEDLVADAVMKLQVVGALARAHTHHQVEEYIRELEASGQTDLAAKVRGELSAAGLLPGGSAPQPAAPVQAIAPTAPPLALPPSPPAPPAAPAAPPALPAPRKRGRPRKNPSPGESFRPGTAS